LIAVRARRGSNFKNNQNLLSSVLFTRIHREKKPWMNFYAGGPKFLIQFGWPPIDAQADAAQKVAPALDE
jgi:hypothetical protein